MERAPGSGEFYRDSENRQYQIITIAKHAKTGEALVVYQVLEGDFGIFALPAELFEREMKRVEHPHRTPERDAGGDETLRFAPVEASVPATETIDPRLMAFFDADDLQEKYNILMSMRDCVDDRMINNMAVALDVVIPEGEIGDRYEALKNCIRTKQRYESDRLRF